MFLVYVKIIKKVSNKCEGPKPRLKQFQRVNAILIALNSIADFPRESLNSGEIPKRENMPQLQPRSGIFQSAQIYISLVVAGRTHSVPPIVLDPSRLVCILYPFLLCPNPLNSIFYTQFQVHPLYSLTAHGSFNHSKILSWTHLSRSFQKSIVLPIPNIRNLRRSYSFAIVSIGPGPPAWPA